MGIENIVLDLPLLVEACHIIFDQQNSKILWWFKWAPNHAALATDTNLEHFKYAEAGNDPYAK